MARLSDKLIRLAFGTAKPGPVGRIRVMQGLREGDERQLYIGLSLLALSYLRRTQPRKKLLYSRSVPEGTALVIHNKGSGDPRLEIVKPKKRWRRS